ncbi:c-type cytochrome [Aromatoleum sp.]|uniref:c-type cytochrome n=1 Tax=Aromatoleum sp. TaxID=2307007 RepID=UPI002FC6DEAF
MSTADLSSGSLFPAAIRATSPHRVLGRFAAVVCIVLAGCGDNPPPALGGDPDNGRLLLRQFGCGSCHRIPGVAAARGNVGPSLEGVATRVYLGGVLPNTPENMVRWIRNPKQFDPETAMPDLPIAEGQARDIVAYLQGLK